MAAGVYNDNYRSLYQDVSYDHTILAADSTTLTACPSKAGYTVFVQAIIFDVTTDNAATLSFKDTASTPVVIHATKASPGLGASVTSVDFGPEGRACTEAKDLQVVFSGAGLAGSLKILAYRKQTSTLAA